MAAAARLARVRGMGTPTDRRYNLRSAFPRAQVLNVVNVATPSGVLGRRFIGQPNALATDPFLLRVRTAASIASAVRVLKNSGAFSRCLIGMIRTRSVVRTAYWTICGRELRPSFK